MLTNQKLNEKLLRVLREAFRPCPKMTYLTGVIIAGGAVTSLLQREKPNDYDLFLTSKDMADRISRDLNIIFQNVRLQGWTGGAPLAVVEEDGRISITGTVVSAYLDRLNSALKSKSLALPELETIASVRHITENAICIGQEVQLIICETGSAESILDGFDFLHCKAFWRPAFLNESGGRTYVAAGAQESLLAKELIYDGGSKNLLTAINRIARFASRGWSIAPTSCLQIMLDAQKFDLSDKDTVVRQLSGFYGIDRSRVSSMADAMETFEVNTFVDQLKEIA